MKNNQNTIKPWTTISFLLVVALFLATIVGVQAQDIENNITLDSTTWTLMAYGHADAMQFVQPGTEITSTFDLESGAITGDAGCNTYSARFETMEDTITISPIVSTMMACEGAVMDQEAAFLSLLQTAESYTITNGKLQMTAGDQILVFVPQQNLGSTTWVLIAYGQPDTPQTILPGTEITSTFDLESGAITGDAGCNTYSATFETMEDTITISPIVATEMACEGAVMDQEAAFLSLLQTAGGYTITNGKLQMTAGDQVLVFVSKAAAQAVHLIVITAPETNEQIKADQPLQIAGIGRGLFEGNVVVQVLDAQGNILALQATIAQGEDVGVGGTGRWVMEMPVEAEPGTLIQVMAYSESPRDGSIETFDHIWVMLDAEN